MAGVNREGRVERARYWQGLVEEHSRSGLSVVEFCRDRKIAATSFYHWRTKLQRGTEAPAAQAPALLPVKLVGAPVEQSKSVGRSCIQLLTPSGVSVTISGAAAEADLVKLLRAIDSAEAARSC